MLSLCHRAKGGLVAKTLDISKAFGRVLHATLLHIFTFNRNMAKFSAVFFNCRSRLNCVLLYGTSSLKSTFNAGIPRGLFSCCTVE